VSAWTAALVLMALGEVVARTAVLAWRSTTVRRQAWSGTVVPQVGSVRPVVGAVRVHDGER